MIATPKRSFAAYRAEQRAAHSTVARAVCQSKARRKRLEADPCKWLSHYLRQAYPLAMGEPHKRIIASALYAAKHGGNMAVGAPRGTGKSSLVWGLVVYLLVTGQEPFPAVVPWETRASKRALRFWKNAFCFNAELLADYPEFCAPFAVSKGSSQRLLALTWEDTGENTGARLSVSEGLIIMPDSRGILGSTTINANPRGLNHATDDGQILRPGLVVIEDPQDKEAAKSPTQVAEIIETIDSDVLGMGGPDHRISALMTCTVIKTGDVASHYLSSPEWDSIKIKRIVTWPTDRKLWDEWNDIRVSGEESKDGGKAALAFYRANKARMLEGFTVSWAARYDKKRKQPDAFYSAMFDFYRMGEATFAAEMQNEPLTNVGAQYELTVELVLAHVCEVPRLHFPPHAGIVCGHVDINRAGLHWSVIGFGNDMTAHVAAYGKHPQHGELWAKNAPELVRKQAIYAGLKTLCAQLAATVLMRGAEQVRPSLILIDRGYEPDVVHKFCAIAAYPFRVMPARGYAAHKYWPRKSSMIGQPMEGCHVTRSDVGGTFVSFNADLWRETSQRALLGEAGSPGGLTIHAGPPATHRRLAEHLCAEQLVNKYQTDLGARWEWARKPGSNWDYADTVTGSYVAAALSGLSTSGITMPPTRRAARRRATGVSVISM